MKYLLALLLICSTASAQTKYPYFNPGPSGPVKSNGTYALQTESASDLIPLWTGTPSSTLCLGSQGSLLTCAGGGGSSAFNAITSGTNTTAAMLVGSGSSLGPTGTGSLISTSLAALTGLPSVANQAVLCNGSGTTAAPIACTLGGNLVATASGLTTSQSINPQTGTTYAFLSTDAGKIVTFSNAASIAVTLSQANAAGFTAGYSVDVQNKGAGTVTITPSTSTINGATTLAIPTNTGCTVTSDGTNYQVTACTAVAPGGGGGSSAWSALTSGTNTTGAFLIGTGATLGTTGTGTLQATSLSGLTGIPAIATQTVLGNGSGSTVSPVALTLGGSLVATATTLGTSQAINAQTGTTYTVVNTDAAKILTFSNASSIAVTLPQAGTTGFTSGFSFDTANKGAGTVTITPATSTINGLTTLTIATNRGCTVTSDGTNYQVTACTAIVTTSGTGTVTSVAATVPTGFAVSGSPVTTSGTLAITKSGDVVGGTKFTVAATGCTPSATAGGATAGTITLATGPCTSLVVTMNGATGLAAPTGWSCVAHDRTAVTIPAWGEGTSSTTTATISVPAAAGATDVISFSCTGF